MIKRLLALTLTAILLFFPAVDAFAGKGGGVSSSGGGRSSPSFSGGSRSTPSFGGGSRSTPSFGGGKSVSGGGKTPTFGGGSSVKPSPAPSFGGGSSNTNKPTFGGGSSTSKPPPGTPTFGGGSSGKTVTTTPIPGRTPVSVSKKPVAESFDRLSGVEAKKAESRKSYERSEAPAATYKTPAGKEVPLTGDKRADYLRGRLDEAHWQTRHQRVDVVFYGSYTSRPMLIYNDCYHPYWNYWLLSQSLDVMSLWVYHHQMEMMRQDRARLDYLYSQNADLRARVAALERQGIPRDPNFTPRGVDVDVMYNDGYVNGCINPRPRMADHYEYGPVSSGAGWVCLAFFGLLVALLLGYAVYWAVFQYRW